MKNSNQLLKLISINLTILISLLISPHIFLQVFLKVRDLTYTKQNKTIDPAANYPIFNNKEMSQDLLRNIDKLNSNYKPYIISRTSDFKSKYLNISGKYNARRSIGEEINNSTWFFGGSTMWGYGSSDQGTIPSIYNKLTKKSVFNFGDQNWTARQSLNQLISVIADGYSPSNVIFYDGVNDVSIGCNKNIKDFPSSDSVETISKALGMRGNSMETFSSSIQKFHEEVLESYNRIGRKFKLNLSSKSNKNVDFYDCHNNPIKRRKIAAHLVNDWYSAYQLAKANNSNFHAILQPTLFSSESSYEYFSKQEKSLLAARKKQFDSVYPAIIKEVNKKCNLDPYFCDSFVDGSKWIPKSSQVFIDFCHITQEGNLIVVKELINHIENNLTIN